jgi:FkbM family methyltransferase
LNGGFNGLYGEVVTEDSYRLKKLKFVPDIIFDMGANVGVFSRFARELFPDAKIISIEPDNDNCKVFRENTKDENTYLLQAAIGTGAIWRCDGAVNGAHECYLSAGLGYPFKVGNRIKGINETKTESLMPDKIINDLVKEGMKSVVKIDIEGNENVIFTHEPSMEALRRMDYITMEIHWGALTGEFKDEVCQKTFEALASFIPTHNCQLVNTMFWATKK